MLYCVRRIGFSRLPLSYCHLQCRYCSKRIRVAKWYYLIVYHGEVSWQLGIWNLYYRITIECICLNKGFSLSKHCIMIGCIYRAIFRPHFCQSIPLKHCSAQKIFLQHQLLQESGGARYLMSKVEKPSYILRKHFIETIYCAYEIPAEPVTSVEGTGKIPNVKFERRIQTAK